MCKMEDESDRLNINLNDSYNVLMANTVIILNKMAEKHNKEIKIVFEDLAWELGIELSDFMI